MGDKSQIEWTDATWNPVSGCTKVSAGCKHCYAERLWKRLSAAGQPYEGRSFADVACHPERLDQPLRWSKPRRVFVNSMSDLFHDAVPFEFVAAVFGVMAASPQHTFQVLTKRPERALEFFAWLPALGGECPWTDCHMEALLLDGKTGRIHRGGKEPDEGRPWPLPNVWLGVSVEDQTTADERIPLLLQCPAAVRFISAEPLLEPVDVGDWLGDEMDTDNGTRIAVEHLHWVICGGESGPDARAMRPRHVRSLRDQCAEAVVPFFFKQWGAWLCAEQLADVDAPDQHEQLVKTMPNAKAQEVDRMSFYRVGKRAAGRLLDGCEHMEYPR